MSHSFVYAFCFSLFLGAAVGVTLGGFLLSLNVDLGHKTSITPTDSRWIGNWWLAWVMGCLTSILLAPGIYGFPPVIRGAPENNNEQENNENTKHETVILSYHIHPMIRYNLYLRSIRNVGVGDIHRCSLNGRQTQINVRKTSCGPQLEIKSAIF